MFESEVRAMLCSIGERGTEREKGLLYHSAVGYLETTWVLNQYMRPESPRNDITTWSEFQESSLWLVRWSILFVWKMKGNKSCCALLRGLCSSSTHVPLK
jgi:hypothetical protein